MFWAQRKCFDRPKLWEVLRMKDYPSLMQPVIDLVQVKVLFGLSKPA